MPLNYRKWDNLEVSETLAACAKSLPSERNPHFLIRSCLSGKKPPAGASLTLLQLSDDSEIESHPNVE